MPCGIDAGRVRWLEFGHHIGLWHGAHYPLPVVANRGFEFLDLFVNRVIGDEAFEYVVLMTGHHGADKKLPVFRHGLAPRSGDIEPTIRYAHVQFPVAPGTHGLASTFDAEDLAATTTGEGVGIAAVRTARVADQGFGIDGPSCCAGIGHLLEVSLCRVDAH